MTEKLEEMWAEMAKHQPIADKLGYGVEWAHMCELKTQEAAWAAGEAAAGEAAAKAAKAAGGAAGWAAANAWGAAGWAAWAAARALEHVRKANELGGVL